VAVIWNPDVRGALLDFKQLEEPARSMGVQLQSIEASAPTTWLAAFRRSSMRARRRSWCSCTAPDSVDTRLIVIAA
jgi:hypothetical protein